MASHWLVRCSCSRMVPNFHLFPKLSLLVAGLMIFSWWTPLPRATKQKPCAVVLCWCQHICCCMGLVREGSRLQKGFLSEVLAGSRHCCLQGKSYPWSLCYQCFINQSDSHKKKMAPYFGSHQNPSAVTLFLFFPPLIEIIVAK